MAGIIERNAKTPMTLKRRSGIVDGKPSYAEFACRGMLFDFSQADLDYFGKIGTQKTVLLAPLDGVVDTTCKISFDGKEYNISAVKTIRNLKGVLLGYKVVI